MTIKYIECHGSPREMGRAYGEQAKIEIMQMLNSPKYSQLGAKLDELAPCLTILKNMLQSELPDIYQELLGIAEGAGINNEEILMLNHSDIFELAPDSGCTPIGLHTKDQGWLIAKNNDGPPHEKDIYPFIIRKTIPHNGLPMLQISFAGWLSGLDSLNSAGLSNTHGSVGSIFQKNGRRIDIRLAMYHLMRHEKSAPELFKKLNKFSLTGKGFNIIVGDNYSQTMVIEAAVPLLCSRTIHDDFCFTTNHFISPGLEDADRRTAKAKKISVYRLGYLEWVKNGKPHNRGREFLLELLSSHAPWGPCRHGGIQESETFWSQICIGQERKLLIAHGHPCEHNYKEYIL
jgi:predicted choloylglycine hydrolase